MPDLKHWVIGGTTYDIVDETAREGAMYALLVVNTGKEGAEVSAVNGNLMASGTTGNDGTVTLAIPSSGTYTVSATLNGATFSNAIAVTEKNKTYLVNVEGINIVSFSSGTDEEIGQMIDYAHAHPNFKLSDYWAVGDTRTIHVNKFNYLSGNSMSALAAQDGIIAITSFDEYNSCGNVLQFDFTKFGMYTQAFNQNSYYSNCNLYYTSLPNMANALPDAIKSRLLTFDCESTYYTDAFNAKTAANNKLAIRSTYEVFGTAAYSIEGGKQLDYYKTTSNRIKHYKSGNAIQWWLRSGTNNGANTTDRDYVKSDGTYAYTNYDIPYAIFPFGCL